jgi:hypothetical protein
MEGAYSKGKYWSHVYAKTGDLTTSRKMKK